MAREDPGIVLLRAAQREAAAGLPPERLVARLHDAVLPALEGWYHQDRPIDDAEAVERLLKDVLRVAAATPGTPDTAVMLARFQQRLGLLVKRKSYALKLSHPLGYSVFLQSPGMGFSFQRHTRTKAEVFHILHAAPGAFVFLCDHATWQRVYRPGPFQAWLDGAVDPRYDDLAHRPRPGDVFLVGTGDIVHSVFGCHLEEFATTSVDRVDRLHDQNLGRAMPPEFGARLAARLLANLRVPAAYRRDGREPIPATPIQGGARYSLCDAPVHATHFHVDRTTGPLGAADEVSALYVLRGAGSLWFATTDGSAPRSLPIARGDVLTVPVGVQYGLQRESTDRLVVSEQRSSAVAAFE